MHKMLLWIKVRQSSMLDNVGLHIIPLCLRLTLVWLILCDYMSKYSERILCGGMLDQLATYVYMFIEFEYKCIDMYTIV